MRMTSTQFRNTACIDVPIRKWRDSNILAQHCQVGPRNFSAYNPCPSRKKGVPSMIRKRRLVMWPFAAAGIAAFVLGASAQQAVRAISQGVVTPGDPIWAQEPQNPPAPPQEGEPQQD